MSVKRPELQKRQDLAFNFRARPVSGHDLVLLQSAMAEAAPDWSVELQGICTDEATIVLLPENGDDEMGPSFMVSRETYGLRVDQVHWDVITEIGVYATMADVVEVLRLRVAFCPGQAVPSSVTIH